MTTYFTPALFEYLDDLAANNNREWFNSNKDRYLSLVQEPALRFITDFEPYLHKISPAFVADTRVQGGSLFRIYRDTRFSKDKTPYKTNTGVQFRHQAGKDAHAPGFYLHLEPGSCFTGLGLWRPEPPLAQQIRQAIADQPALWKKVAHGKAFEAAWNQGGESLARPPKGFPPDHPLIDDLKRKDFIAGRDLTEDQVMSPTFIKEYAAMCRSAAPYVQFLCSAVGVSF